MSKSKGLSMPLPSGRGKKFLALALLALLLVAVVRDPTGSARAVHAVWGALSSAGHSVFAFLHAV